MSQYGIKVISVLLHVNVGLALESAKYTKAEGKITCHHELPYIISPNSDMSYRTCQKYRQPSGHRTDISIKLQLYICFVISKYAILYFRLQCIWPS